MERSSLPSNWTYAQLGEVCRLIAGCGFPLHLQGRTSGEFPFFKVADISCAWKRGEQYLHIGNHYVDRADLASLRAQPLPAGSVVFAKIGEAISLNRRAMLRVPSLVDNNVMGLVPDPALVTADYLFYWSQTIKLERYSRATTVPSLRKSDLEQIPIPLPPLAEQVRLTAELEKHLSYIDNAFSSLKRAKNNLASYRASVLMAACEGRLVPTEAELVRSQGRSYEPATILLGSQAKVHGTKDLPEGWAWTTFEQISERVTVGHVGPMKHEYIETGIPFLRSQNVRENRFDPEGLRFISRDFHKKLSKSVLRPGDIVLVRSGSVGVACVIPDYIEEANCADLVIVRSPIGLVPKFGAYYMNSLAKELVRRGKVGIALTHFNTKSVANLPVPLPPYREQERIVAKVESQLSFVDQLETMVNAALRRAEQLRASLLKSAFEGRLVSQDPNDKPASILLSGIRQESKTEDQSRRRGRRPASKIETPRSRSAAR